jgi:hypothetical protein
LANDDIKPIELIQPGEEILSINTATGDQLPGVVGEVYSLLSRDVASITLQDGTVFRLTSGHPVYCRGQYTSGWFAVDPAQAIKENPDLQICGEIVPGMMIRAEELFEWPVVVFVERGEAPEVVHNLRCVEPFHNFFANHLLVHNKGACFLAGSKITMEDGTEKSIETVTAGEKVMTYNELTEEPEVGEVMGVEDLLQTAYYNVITDAGTLNVTAEHPIAVYHKGEIAWAAIKPFEARKTHPYLRNMRLIQIGDTLVMEHGQALIQDIVEVKGEVQVYNLWSVKKTMTFYVDGFLVHNKGACFLAGTRIQMADGTEKPIENVKVDDKILSFNESTRKVEVDEVRMVEAPVADQYCQIELPDRVLHVTSEHPLYGRKRGIEGWIAVDSAKSLEEHPYMGRMLPDLEVGDELYSRFEGTWLQVSAIDTFEGQVQTYNIASVRRTMTYFADDILVHNKGGCFLAGTLITMADDTMKKVQDLLPGEQLKSWNPKTKEMTISKLTDVVEKRSSVYYQYCFLKPSGRRMFLEATPDHPIMICKYSRVTWCSMDPDQSFHNNPGLATVGLLRIGDRVLLDTGAKARIVGIRRIFTDVAVYDVRGVENTSTFFANHVLVHNKGGRTEFNSNLFRDNPPPPGWPPPPPVPPCPPIPGDRGDKGDPGPDGPAGDANLCEEECDKLP